MPQQRSVPAWRQQPGLYVHIPFCRAKCAYCDFFSLAGRKEFHGAYVDALLREAAAARGAWQTRSFGTVYVGGGTPTFLETGLLDGLLVGLRRHLPIDATAEITIEANPGTVRADCLVALQRSGVNRLSLGVQSLQDAHLRLLGRIHTAADALDSFSVARNAGFENLSVDLMFGIPRQTMADWAATLDRILHCEPEHLSLYCLTLEDGTPLADAVRRREIPVPDDDLAADMFEYALDTLPLAGYRHYEVSNWARDDVGTRSGATRIPRWACAHNVKYWLRAPYLGLGLAAHSFDGAQRWANTHDLCDYVANADRDVIVYSEPLTPDIARAEAMMLGLRLSDGVHRDELLSLYGLGLDEAYGTEIDRLVAQGLLVSDSTGVRLTRRGVLLGNRVFGAFV